MHGELITIGDELLSGRTVNNNAAHMGHHLRLAGFQIRWTTVVGDREEDIVAALQRAMARAPFVLVTGGLGPTADDRTSAAVALALGTPLRRDPESWEVITSHLKKHNIPMTQGIAKMAELPEGARRIDLARPRAGYYMSYADKPLFFLPRLAAVEKKYSTVGFGYFPHFPENRMSLTVQATTATSADAILEEVVEAVVLELGLYVYGRGDDRLEMVVGRSLMDNGYTLALAESCTGGLIAHLITNVPGSSAYFDRSMVAYSDAAKTSHLLVSPDLISQHGVVSAQVAEAMVRGLKREGEPHIALAVTGLAGPAGGTAEKPVGTVFLALLSDKGLRTERFQFGGEREKIKLAAAYTALDWLRRAMIDESFFAAG
jgi:nicotinamide-nucleotide amidase